ncbi:MAG: RHS repeat protein, partial [Sphingobacteriales bacterium]
MYIAIKKQIIGPLFSILVLIAQTASAQNLNSPNKIGPLGIQVNAFTGNLFLTRLDIFLPAKGFPIEGRFSYNSYRFTENNGFGNGWTFEYNINYRHDTIPGRKIIQWGDGREDKYDSLPDGSYQTPTGFYTRLKEYSPGRLVLSDRDSTLYFFDNSVHKKLTRIQDANGNFLRFVYAEGRLTSLENNSGQTIQFTYNNNGNLASTIDAVTSPTRTYTYQYDGSGNLTAVKDAIGHTYTYSYLVNGPMKAISDKNNNSADIIYFPDFSAKELIGCNNRLSFSYDTSAKKTIITEHLENGNNQVTTITYEKKGSLAWITSMKGNCCGFETTFEYDGWGNITKQTDANGNSYHYTYDDRGNQLTIKDPLGYLSSYTYSTDHNKVTSYKDANGNLYSLDYDEKGNLIKMIAPGGYIYTATYNSAGDILTSTEPNGHQFIYEYDSYGNPISVKGPQGYSATLRFDARGNLLSYRNANGHSHTATYDILDRLKTITDPLNQSVQLAYDPAGNLISYKSKNNETSFFSYDASNRLVKLVDALGNTTERTYDGNDNLTSVKNALGYFTRIQYDSRGLLSTVTDMEGHQTGISYDANGNITSIQLVTGQRLLYSYDKLNRLTTASDQNGLLASFTYDAAGNPTSYSNGEGLVLTALYDSLNRVTRMTDALGYSTLYRYDQHNNIVAVTDRNGLTKKYTYDNLNRIRTATDASGFMVNAEYDPEGNLVSLTDQNENKTTYTYDELNRRKTMQYADGSLVKFFYDKNDNLTAKTLPDGSTITFSYDALNRVKTKTLPDGQVFSYEYDALGRIIAATNQNGEIRLAYDKLNRLVSETFEGKTIRHHYNKAGRTQTTVYPGGTTVVKEFDIRNRLIRITKDSVQEAEYTYNKANRLIRQQLGNGVATTLNYDITQRISSLTTTATAQHILFEYDKEGNKVAIVRTNEPSLTETLGYDKSYRLTTYKRGSYQNSYSYDAVGNRMHVTLNGTKNTYATNSLNQLTQVNGNTLTYDLRGNLTYDGNFYKMYDAEGRLVKDSAAPARVNTYGYDAFGRRITKTGNGKQLRYTYSRLAAIEERSDDTLINQTVYTHFLSPVLNVNLDRKFYFHQNELNSVQAITNEQGRLIERYLYDPFGAFQRYDSAGSQLPTSPSGNRVAFTGQIWNEETENYHFFFRDYSPATGRFLQRDLLEYEDGMALYQYVGNDPANGIDIMGLRKVEVDPCPHDPNKVKYITSWEIEREKQKVWQNQLEKFTGKDMLSWFKSDFKGIGAADSRFYNKLLKSQHGDNMYYFKG